MTNGFQNQNGFDPWTFYYLGIFTFIFTIGFIFLNETQIKVIPNILPVASIVFTFIFFIIAAGLSRSHQRMSEIIIDSHISEILYFFSERRLTMREKMLMLIEKDRVIPNYRRTRNFLISRAEFHIYLSFSIWQCRSILNWILLFNEHFEQNHEEQIIHQIDCLFLDLVDGKYGYPITLSPEYQGHLQEMVDIISYFTVFNRETEEEDFRRSRILINLGFLQDEYNYFVEY